jgi:hypothetical protein
MKQLLVISCLLLTITTTTTTATATASADSTKSWFREKYLEYYHDEYYDYYMSLNQYSNKRVICTDFHKSATVFAITGRRQRSASAARTNEQQHRTCPTILLYAAATTLKHTDYLPQEEYYPRLIRIAVEEILEPLGDFMCDVFKIYIIMMSVILASIFSVFIIMLIFCQY